MPIADSSHPVRVQIRPGMIVAFPAEMDLKQIETAARRIQLSDLTNRYDSADKSEQEKIRDAVLQYSIQLRKAAKGGEISDEDFATAQREVTKFSNKIAGTSKPVRKRK
jgi:hypothetical protein